MQYNCSICECWFVCESDLQWHYKAHDMYGDDLPSMLNKRSKTIKGLIELYQNYLDKHGRGYQEKLGGKQELEQIISYESLEWIELSNELKAKKNYQCEICESKIDVQCHHIIPAKHAPEKFLDINNLIVLCRPCHIKTHEGYIGKLKQYAWDKAAENWVDFSEKDWNTCIECGDPFYGERYLKYCRICWVRNKRGYE